MPSRIEGDKLIIDLPDLPDAPKATVTVTADIPWGIHEEANAHAQSIQDGYTVTNIARFFGALVRGFAADEETKHSFVRDRAGKTLIPFDPMVIDRQASRDDVQYLAQVLAWRFYPEKFPMPEDHLLELLPSAEGNAEPPALPAAPESEPPATASPAPKTRRAKGS